MNQPHRTAVPHRPFPSWLIPISFVLSAASATAGFTLDALAFLLNILAGLVCIFLGAAATLLIVERYLTYQRELQWNRVEEYTVRAIAVHLCEITGSLFLHYPTIMFDSAEPVFSGHNRPPNRDAFVAMARILVDLQQVPSAISAQKSSSDVAIEYYDAVKWDLDQIQGVLTPRLL